MRKLSVLLTLLLVALCTHVSHAWNFWTGSDFQSITFRNETSSTEIVMTETTTADNGKLWYAEFTPTTESIEWKWYVTNGETKSWYGRGVEYSLGMAWTDMAAKDNGRNTIKGLDTSKLYRIEIKGKSQSDNSTPQGRVFLVEEGEEEYDVISDDVYIISDKYGNWTANPSYKFTPNADRTIFTLSFDKLENGAWGFKIAEGSVDKNNQSSKNESMALDLEYACSQANGEGGNMKMATDGLENIVITYYSKNGTRYITFTKKEEQLTTYTITVGNTSAYNGFTFGNLKVLVNGNWEDTTDGKYTGATAPTAFKYETVTLPAGGHAQNFVWEGELSGTDSELSGNLNDLAQRNFKFTDNENNTFGEPNVKVVSNGIELVAMNVTATRVANAYDYTVMTNRTSLDGAQVSFTSNNAGHDAVSGTLTDGATYTAGEQQQEESHLYYTGIVNGETLWGTAPNAKTISSTNGIFEITVKANDQVRISTSSSSSWSTFNANVLCWGTGSETLDEGVSKSYGIQNCSDGHIKPTKDGTLYIDTNRQIIYLNNRGSVSSTVNMPLKQSDFAADGSKKHYFIVGSRMGGWRLQPEWELTVEGNQAVLNNRLMYPGAFAIGMVDNYDDYVNQRYTLYTSNDGTSGSWVNKDAASVTLTKDQNPAEGIVYGSIEGKTTWNYHITKSGLENNGHLVMFFDWDKLANKDNWVGSAVNAIKTGNPAFVQTFTVGLNTNGEPASLSATALSPVDNRRAVIGELNFTLVGTNIRNQREADGKAVFDYTKTPLASSGVKEWGATWVQYDPETKMPYVDGRGQYIYQTVYQTNWLESHPTYFYRKAEEMEYDSNSLRLRPLSEIVEEGTDEYLPYYQAMLDRTLGDGTLKTSGIDLVTREWHYKDKMAVANNDPVAPSTGGWIPFVASDVYFGGEFKIWTGFGGGHLGYGTWDSSVDGLTLYMWNSINAGGSQKNTNTDVAAFNINVPAAKVDDNYVTVYATKRDVEGANFQASKVENDKASLRYYKRIIFWYNPELGVDNSVLQLILGDYEARIEASHATDNAKTAIYKWYTVKDPAVDEDNVLSYKIERYRNGEFDALVKSEDNVSSTFSSFTADAAVPARDENLPAGEYTYRLIMELENAGTRSVTSNPVTIYEAGQPVELTAVQHSDADGNVAFQVDANVKIKSSVINFTDQSVFEEGKTLSDYIAGVIVTYADGSNTLTETYDPASYDSAKGLTVKFAAEPGKVYDVNANIVLKDETPDDIKNLVDFVPATGKVTVNYPELTVSDVTVRALGEEVTEGYYSELAEGEEHHGHNADHPVYYQKVNNLQANATVSHNWIPGDCEDAKDDVAVLAIEHAGMTATINAGTMKVNYLPVPAADGEMVFTVKAGYVRGGNSIGSIEAESEGVTPDMTLENIGSYAITEGDVTVVTDGVHGNGGGNNEWNKVNMYDLYVPFTHSEATADLYTSYGFEVSDYRNYTDGHEHSGDWMQGTDNPHAIDPYIWPNNGLGLTGGADGYTLYDGTEWTSANDWGHLMGKNNQFAIMLDHIDCDYGGTPGVTVKKEVVAWNEITFTIHKYYPFVVANELKVEPTNVQAAPAMYAAAMPDAYVTLVQPASASAKAVLPAGSKSVSSGIITGVENVSVDANLPVDVYTVGGALIMRRTSKAEALKTLAPGIYMIGGEKVVVK